MVSCVDVPLNINYSVSNSMQFGGLCNKFVIESQKLYLSGWWNDILLPTHTSTIQKYHQSGNLVGI